VRTRPATKAAFVSRLHPSRVPEAAGLILWLCAAITALLAGCGAQSGKPETIRFWAMGREGEVVQELVPEFEREHPGVRVLVQQLPWSAAHEKLLTSFVGRSTPDIAQLGNTWISEFAALGALEPLDPRLGPGRAIDSTAFFPGIWRTNLIDGTCYGIPWYVDTRLLFYRRDLLAAAGYDSLPGTWEEWRESMRAIRRLGGPDRYAIFLPVNEWVPPVVLGLQAGSPLLSEGATRGAFRQPEFRRAFAFYLDLFREGWLARIDPLINWWNFMETTFGAVFGAALATGLWCHRRRIVLAREPALGWLAPAVEWVLAGTHAALLVIWEFDYPAAVPATILPVLVIAGGRYGPYLFLLPLVALPIAAKTLTHLGGSDSPIPPAAWLLCLALPLVLTTVAAGSFARQADQPESARRFTRRALLGCTWLYFGLNLVVFEFPWPWTDWTARTPNALVYAVCAVGLSCGALECFKRKARGMKW